MGLMKYVMKTPLADYIDITFTESMSEEVSTDKWNNWVFKTRLSGSIDGEETSNSKYA